MKPLSVLAYFDGRPGHEKQTRGILNALSGLTPINVDSIKVSTTPAAYLGNLVSFLLPFGKTAAPDGTPKAADLIIGTGFYTHIPMIQRKMRLLRFSSDTQVRVVTCMTPEKPLLRRFDLCCIPMHDEPAEADNVFVTQGPPNTLRQEGRHRRDRGLVLVGGVDAKSHVWKSAETVDRIRVVIEKGSGMSWTVSSSPRTPEETCRSLSEMAAEMAEVSFFRSGDTPAGWVEEQYALNGSVWVTADSVSMVYEALTAGCSVGILPVDWLKRENKFVKSLRFLTERKMIVDFAAWRQGSPLPGRKDHYFNESLRCAREILRRWWPDRLQ